MEKEAYTVREAATLLRYSRWTIMRMFEHEPGVLIIKPPNGTRRMLRIPRTVLLRVVHKMTVP
jgi:hypothetical protein